MPVRMTPIVRKSRISEGHEIELRRETTAGDRLGSHVLSELTMDDIVRLRDALSWYVTEGQYQE